MVEATATTNLMTEMKLGCLLERLFGYISYRMRSMNPFLRNQIIKFFRQPKRANAIVKKFSEVFPAPTEGLGYCILVVHKIDTRDVRPMKEITKVPFLVTKINCSSDSKVAGNGRYFSL